MTDVTHRFADRADVYARSRPTYPPEVLQTLVANCGLRPEHVVADIGSGTGILTEILLGNGNLVYAVEPNAAMRTTAEEKLGMHPRFRSVAGRAESTGLADASVDLITAAQAFHWFDVIATREEWERILRPEGWAFVIWNTRCVDTSAFLRDYEQLLLDFGTDYRQVRHRWGVAGEDVRQFFGAGGFGERHAIMVQEVDYAGLEGRLLSSSYVPAVGHPQYEPMLAALREIYARHEREGLVAIEYDTEMYFGRL